MSRGSKRLRKRYRDLKQETDFYLNKICDALVHINKLERRIADREAQREA